MTLFAGQRMQSLTFLTLPGTLPFAEEDFVDTGDLFTVPDPVAEFCLSSEDSDTDILLPELEATSSTASDIPQVQVQETQEPCSPREHVVPCLQASHFRQASSLAQRQSVITEVVPQPSTYPLQPPAPAPAVPAPAPAVPAQPTLRLQLNWDDVLSEWNGLGGVNPFHLHGPQLAAACASVHGSLNHAGMAPSPDYLPSNLPAQPSSAVSSPSKPRPRPSLPEAVLHGVQHKSSTRRPRAPGTHRGKEKRPRIKGRFVTRAEFEEMMAQQASSDRAVPRTARATCPSLPPPSSLQLKQPL